MSCREEAGDRAGSRERAALAIRHKAPDRTPVDFLATPEIWEKLIARFGMFCEKPGDDLYFDPIWEEVLQTLEVDCRLVSYDMFCLPPESALPEGSRVDWWGSLGRSTPNRMFRLKLPDGMLQDIWGNRYRKVVHESGAYEELDSSVLAGCSTIEEVRSHAWPRPDWWDFSSLSQVIRQMDEGGERHVRFRIGSVFETAWQMRGMEQFLLDLALEPRIPRYILERIAEIHLENTRAAMEAAGDRLNMLYFYDDVASQSSLLVSVDMWKDYIRPHHARLIGLAHSKGIPMMYHCDGALYPLIPDLLDMGIDVLNPVQLDAIGAPPERLKAEFGDRLAFHGGLDIMELLPKGTPDQIRREVRRLIDILGVDGGYILCSSHHIQPNTPVENVLAAYEPELRKIRKAHT